MSFWDEAVGSCFISFFLFSNPAAAKKSREGKGMQYLRGVFACIILVIFTANQSWSQSYNFQDGFEDGDFTANPSWSGDTSQFTIIDTIPNHLLQLQGDDVNGGISYLSTSSTNIIGSWEFFVNLDFSPSGGNNATIFLMSDIANLAGPVNGYAIQIGESGSSDVIRLVKYVSGSPTTTLLSGTTNISSGGAYRIKVTRLSGGDWTLEVGTGYDGMLMQEGGTQTDNTYTTASYFGVLATYTSSRADLFTFDFKIDLPPFIATSVKIIDDQTLDIAFNRAVDQASAELTDFSFLNHSLTPAGLQFPATDTVRIRYSQPLPSDLYTISVSDISDLSGNPIQPATFNFIVFGNYSTGDIKINEFTYDPPEGQAEFVELINTSNQYLNLSGWQIGDESGMQILGENPIVIAPDSFLVISGDTASLMNVYGPRAYYQWSNLPSLNNTGGDMIHILTNNNNLADSLHYTSEWGGKDVALERRSLATHSYYKGNWGNSPNPLGGTPGLPNEIEPDSLAPALTSLTIQSSSNILLEFDERIAETGTAAITNGANITSIIQMAPDSLILNLSPTLEDAQTYMLSISGAEDIFGNAAVSFDTTFTFYRPSPADSGDIVINEFLYDPPSGLTEYIELYNVSNKSLDLREWTLSDNRGYYTTISNTTYIIPPDSFIVIAPDNSLLSVFPDIALQSMNNFPALNNSGDAIVLRNKQGIILDSLSYSSGWGGTERALERRNASISGTYRANWDEAPIAPGSAGSPNNVAPDQSAPSLRKLKVISENRLLLIFSERITEQSAKQPANFTLNNNLTVSGSGFRVPDSVFLSLDSPMNNGTRYHLSILDISDIFGNTMSLSDTSFTFYRISESAPGDIFINEFSYDPPLGSTEYIELYNPTSKSFDLNGWMLSDSRGQAVSITESPVVLPPDSFIVIAPDNTLKIDFPEVNLVTMGQQFPALNNGGDAISIRNKKGILLDSLQYSDSWGGREVSLERRTVTVTGQYAENWGNSPSGFGTPGAVNDIQADQQPPVLSEVSFSDASTIRLIFSEQLDLNSATDRQHYQISPSVNIQLVSAVQDTVRLFLEGDLESGVTYSIKVSDVSDLFGNQLSESSQTLEYLKLSPAKPGDIVINEFLYRPGSTNSADFIELYNTTQKNIVIQNWFLGDASQKTVISKPITLRSHQYFVLTGSPAFADQIKNGSGITGFPSLNDYQGDAIYLQNAQAQTIDSLFYSSAWGAAEPGSSVERIDPKAASNDPSNWKSSEAFHSAGTQNHHFAEDTSPPHLVFAKMIGSAAIQAQFNEFISVNNKLKFYAGSHSLNITVFDQDHANMITLQAGSSTSLDKNIEIKAQNVTDVKGNLTAETKIPLAQPLTPGDLVVNEIMYNPLAEADDRLPDQSEYLELRNTQNYALSLEGLIVHDAPDENGNTKPLLPVRTKAKWIAPHREVLVYSDPSPTFAKSRLASFFDLVPESNHSILRIDQSSLSLSSSEDVIFIADSTGTTIDSVAYNEGWQNPNIIDPRGIALERIDPLGPSNDQSNWGSSVNAKGGTPAEENSIYQENGEPPAETGISFSPNPFSPDEDGYEDRLFINYKLEQQDYLIKAHIYDRYGRLIKELADGKQAGFEGQLMWDGRKDDGGRNRIGIYIVVFEAYNSAAGRDRAFKKTVVLARKLR